MGSNNAELQELSLSSLPKFRRDKPYERWLYGTLPPTSPQVGNYSLIFRIATPWQEKYARYLEQPQMPGAPPLDVSVLDRNARVARQARCVGSLAKLVELGPSQSVTMPDQTFSVAALDELVCKDPSFYVTARQSSQAGKDPRYVAKIEHVIGLGGESSATASPIIQVSDEKGSIGSFPTNTSYWSLGYLSPGGRFDLTTIPYINDGYR